MRRRSRTRTGRDFLNSKGSLLVRPLFLCYCFHLQALRLPASHSFSLLRRHTPSRAVEGLLLRLPASPRSSGIAPRESRHRRAVTTTPGIMGLGASVLPKEEEAIASTFTTKNGKPKSAKKKKKELAKAQQKEWTKTVDEFTSQVLDESFLTFPIRASTIEAGTYALEMVFFDSRSIPIFLLKHRVACLLQRPCTRRSLHRHRTTKNA